MRDEAENHGTCILERKEQRLNLSSSVGQALHSRSGSLGNAGVAARSCSAVGLRSLANTAPAVACPILKNSKVESRCRSPRGLPTDGSLFPRTLFR
jgi:hypothetical protein